MTLPVFVTTEAYRRRARLRMKQGSSKHESVLHEALPYQSGHPEGEGWVPDGWPGSLRASPEVFAAAHPQYLPCCAFGQTPGAFRAHAHDGPSVA